MAAELNQQLAMKNINLLFIVFIIFYSCIAEEIQIFDQEIIPVTEQDLPNIMLIIADDMGLDATPGYDIGDTKPHMPNLEGLMNKGVRFSNVWSSPACTPTRAGIITGKYGFRTVVTNVGDELSTNELSIQKFLDNKTGAAYSHAVIGKWHLSNNLSHPADLGINHFTGFLSGTVSSYWNWNLVENSVASSSSEYTTTKFTDLAIDWVDAQDKPWFLWLAYNAPHTPFHLPPTNLHSQGSLPEDAASIERLPLPYYMAMLEAMDTEFGRLLASIPQDVKDNTIFIFVGDNGSPNQVAQEYKGFQAKGTIYQGGINVPMVISGKNVTRLNEIEDALINTTDLFATIADLAETGITSINDSKSFKDLLSNDNSDQRAYTYTEQGRNNGQFEMTIRNHSHKYIVFADGSEAMYDLSDTFIEVSNLLDSQGNTLNESDNSIKEALLNALNGIKDN